MALYVQSCREWRQRTLLCTASWWEAARLGLDTLSTCWGHKMELRAPAVHGGHRSPLTSGHVVKHFWEDGEGRTRCPGFPARQTGYLTLFTP